jgi:hypothetical protein
MASTFTDVYPNAAPTIAPQAGKTYRMRNGETVGPMRFRGLGEDWPFLGYVDTGVGRLYFPDGRHHAIAQYDIIAEITPDADAPTAEGPVRRRVTTEVSIAPGVYGKVRVLAKPVNDPFPACVHVRIDDGQSNATELRAAAAVLIALADGLDEMAAK